jgi:chromosome segregation ATPase
MSRKSNHLHHHSHLHHHTPEPSSNNSNTQATHDTTSLATVANSISEQEGDGEAEEECENCFRYKEELKTTRRLLAYERTSNEGLRKAFFELRGALEGDIFEAKSLTFKLEAEVSSLKDEKRIFDRENNKLKNQLTVTKEQLNITNIKLNECEM